MRHLPLDMCLHMSCLEREERSIPLCGRPISEHSPTARTLGARSRKEDRPLGDDHHLKIDYPKKDDTMELNLPAAEVEGTRKAHSRTANMRCFFDPTAKKTPKENRAQ